MSTIGKPLVVLLAGELRKAAALGAAAAKLHDEKDAIPDWDQKYAEAMVAFAQAAHHALFHVGVYPDSPIVVVSLADVATVNTHTVEVVTREKPTVEKPVDAPTPPPEARRDDGNCAVCGRPLFATEAEGGIGCKRGTCSMRPTPQKLYDPARALAEVGWRAEKPEEKEL
jgi:hypothetical protein